MCTRRLYMIFTNNTETKQTQPDPKNYSYDPKTDILGRPKLSVFLFRWWFSYPSVDLLPALLYSLICSATTSGYTPKPGHVFTYGLFVLLVWTFCWFTKFVLDRPQTGFPNGMPANTKKAFRNIISISFGIVFSAIIVDLPFDNKTLENSCAALIVINSVRAYIMVTRLRQLEKTRTD